MVRSIIINQIVVGYSIWLTNGDGRALLSATQFDPTSLVIGAAGGLAVIAVGRFIEKSPNPLFAELNLSTNMLVLRLFGPRPQPIVAGVVSLAIATLVTLTEETVFRGVVTSRLAENLGALPGAGCAILLFALGHINPLALGKETLLL
jgi:membrane protease YdiL (CAAX protease family)